MVCFKRCCCCVNLRVGGIMMGIMTLALSVFSIIPMAISLANRVHMSRVITHMVEEYSYSGTKQDEMNSVAFWGTVSDAFKNDQSSLPPEDNEKVVWLAMAMLIFFIAGLVLLVIYALCSLLLIWGAAKGRRWLMLPWIVVTFAFLLAYVAGMCMTLWLVGIQVLSVFLFFVALVETAIAIYLWTCIISLFQVLGSADWEDRDDWEMRPKFSTKYNGVPQDDH